MTKEHNNDKQPVKVEFSDTARKVFTDQEREIIALYGQGLRGTQIAQHLDIRRATLRTHFSNIISKTRYWNKKVSNEWFIQLLISGVVEIKEEE